MALTASERRLRASIAGNESWSNTDDRRARTEPGRRAFAESFEDKVDPEHKLDPVERAKRAENARKAHYARLALLSAKARRRNCEAAQAAAADGDDLGGAS